jgi:hypothetical protein
MFIRRAALLSAVATITLLSVHAAQNVNLDVDLGLWEVTLHPQQNSQQAAMMERLNSLPPEQLAKFQAMMKQQLGAAHVFHECMTQERRTQGFSTAENAGNCTSTITSNSATDFELHRQCMSATSQRTENWQFKVNGRRQFAGTMDMVVQSQGGRTFSTHTTMDGKWLGSDCGGVTFQEIH